MRRLLSCAVALFSLSASATISQVQSNATWGTTGATCVVNFSSNPTTHNLIAVWTSWTTSGTNNVTASVSDNLNNGVCNSAGQCFYPSAVGPTAQSASNTAAQIFYAPNILGSHADPVTVTFSSAPSSSNCVIVEYSGLDQNYPLDSVSAGYSYSPGSLLDSGTAPPANGNLLVFGGGTSDSGTAGLIANSPFAVIQKNGGSITEQLTVSPSASLPLGNNTLQRAQAGLTSGPGNWLMQMAIFRDASWTVAGAWSPVRPGQIRYAAQYPGADCGAKINAAEADLGSALGEIQVDGSCASATWAAVTMSHNNHSIRFISPGPFTINSILLSGNFDSIIGPAYVSQVGGVDQRTIVSTGSDNLIQGLTLDGSANQPSKNSSDDMIYVEGSRNKIVLNRIVKSQGSGITVIASPGSGTLTDDMVLYNKVYNANVAMYGEGIDAGSSGPTSGVSVNNLLIEGNEVSNVSADCIFVTSDLSSSALATTPTMYPVVSDNFVSGCGDSSIEVSDVVYMALISNNTVDVKNNAGILSRDSFGVNIVGNQVLQESTAAQTGISVGPIRYEPVGWDAHANVADNVIRGYFGGINGGGISVEHDGVNVATNNIEATAGNAAIQSIQDTSGTTTIVTDRPLYMPVGGTIYVAGTAHFNTTFVLATANDLTRTYTSSSLSGTFARETSGTISNTNSSGTGLMGNGINCTGYNNSSINGNKIRNVGIGINFDYGGGSPRASEISVKNNVISKTSYGIDFTNVAFTNSIFDDNFVEQVTSYAFVSNATTTGTVWWNNNAASLSGYSGATPAIYANALPSTFLTTLPNISRSTCVFSSSTTCSITYSTYGTSFFSTPMVFLQPVNPGAVTFVLSATSPSGFTITASASNSFTVNWTAIGNVN